MRRFKEKEGIGAGNMGHGETDLQFFQSLLLQKIN